MSEITCSLQAITAYCLISMLFNGRGKNLKQLLCQKIMIKTFQKREPTKCRSDVQKFELCH